MCKTWAAGGRIRVRLSGVGNHETRRAFPCCRRAAHYARDRAGRGVYAVHFERIAQASAFGWHRRGVDRPARLGGRVRGVSRVLRAEVGFGACVERTVWLEFVQRVVAVAVGKPQVAKASTVNFYG